MRPVHGGFLMARVARLFSRNGRNKELRELSSTEKRPCDRQIHAKMIKKIILDKYRHLYLYR
jgi:hypothetical protein